MAVAGVGVVASPWASASASAGPAPSPTPSATAVAVAASLPAGLSPVLIQACRRGVAAADPFLPSQGSDLAPDLRLLLLLLVVLKFRQ